MNGTYKLANTSLAVALIGTLVSYPFRHTVGGGLIQAGCAAALAGGLADWFAVTALFRHPLGLKIPHTAIIEKNREALINNIADLAQNEMLPLPVIERNINRFNFLDKILEYYQTGNGKKYINKFILHILRELLHHINVDDIAKITSKRIRRQLKKVDGSKALIQGLDWVSAHEYDEDMLDHLLDEVITVVQKEAVLDWIEKIISMTAEEYKEGGFLRRFGINLSVQLDILNYREAAAKIQAKAAAILTEIRSDRSNDYRLKIKRAVFNSFRNSLENDPDMHASIVKWQTELINRLPVEPTVQKILDKARSKLTADINSNLSVTVKVLRGFIDEQVALLTVDEGRKSEIDRWIKERLIKFVQEQIHPRLAVLVKDNLNTLDNQAVVSMVEKRAGRDLQYIRINGAVVGGTVGVLLYLMELVARGLGY